MDEYGETKVGPAQSPDVLSGFIGARLTDGAVITGHDGDAVCTGLRSGACHIPWPTPAAVQHPDLPMTAHEALLINNRGAGQRIGTDPASIELEDAEVAVDGAQRSAGVPRTSGVIDYGPATSGRPAWPMARSRRAAAAPDGAARSALNRRRCGSHHPGVTKSRRPGPHRPGSCPPSTKIRGATCRDQGVGVSPWVARGRRLS